jgi:hypothetical protein
MRGLSTLRIVVRLRQEFNRPINGRNWNRMKSINPPEIQTRKKRRCRRLFPILSKIPEVI